jgi:4,5-DOPA dioxygenase extradiol
MESTSSSRMPAIFVGHGSPMNALEENAYTGAWRQFGAAIPKPKAIVAISAHWFTRGTAVDS